MLSLIKATGLTSLTASNDINDATGHLPSLCASGLTYAESGECDDFKVSMVGFVNSEHVPEVQDNVHPVFPQLGVTSKEDSISFMASNGKSGESPQQPKNKWFADLQSGTCLQDCEIVRRDLSGVHMCHQNLFYMIPLKIAVKLHCHLLISTTVTLELLMSTPMFGVLIC